MGVHGQYSLPFLQDLFIHSILHRSPGKQAMYGLMMLSQAQSSTSTSITRQPYPLVIRTNINTTITNDSSNNYLELVFGSSDQQKYVTAHKFDTRKWNLFTIVGDLEDTNTITVFKNLKKEIIYLDDINVELDGIKFDGLTTEYIDCMIGHITLYDRLLSEQEIFKNYQNYKGMYWPEDGSEDDVFLFDPDAQAYFDRVGNIELINKFPINNFVRSLKANNIWNFLI